MGDGTAACRSAPPRQQALARPQRARTLTAAEVAWVALLPCAAVTVVALLLLGPPLGHLVFRPAAPADALWPPGWWESQGRPEPVKQGRYLIAALGPLLLAGVVLASAARPPRLRPGAIRVVSATSQAALLALAIVALLGQYNAFPGRRLGHVFGPVGLAGAGALVALAVLAPRSARIAHALARLARETSSRRAAGFALAAVVALTWLIEGVITDRLGEDGGAFIWTLNDAFAVLNGRTPLVDYHSLYAKLLPYPAALVIAAFGKTGLVYTLFTTLLNVLVLLAVYAIFRRILRSSLLALGLFVPFVALSGVGHTMLYVSLWPMRYGGAYLLAWLTARHVDRHAPRRAWALFLIGGLVAIDDQEFGASALIASAAALLCARPPRSAAAALRHARDLALGVLGAVALVCAFTLVRAGALPDPALLTEWPRVFSRLGWFSLPLPRAGLYLALYATFAGAIVVAAVRLRRGARNRLLTCMVAWSGVFGLLAGSYYVGRSDDFKLNAILSTWAFALALLTIVTVRALARQQWRRPNVAQLLVLLGFGLAVAAIPRVSPPPDQLARLTRALPPPTYRPTAERFIQDHTRRGERVVILLPMSERIAYELGLRNVSPYGIQDALVTRWQLQTVIDVARRKHAHALFLAQARLAPQQLAMLGAAGFVPRARQGDLLELSDR